MSISSRRELAASAVEYRTKTDLVYQALRKRLLLGQYLPGARIVVDQLALELGTSKVPVREAVVRLTGEGWLQMQPHVGATVPLLHPDEILETSLIRGALESVAVRLAVEHLTADALDRLRALVGAMDAAIASESPDYPDLNVRFHAATIECCPYSNMRAIVESVLEKTSRLRTVRFLPEYGPQSQNEHRRLLDALERRDGAAAESIARQHIERAGRLLWQFAAERISRDDGHDEIKRVGHGPR